MIMFVLCATGGHGIAIEAIQPYNADGATGALITLGRGLIKEAPARLPEEVKTPAAETVPANILKEEEKVFAVSAIVPLAVNRIVSPIFTVSIVCVILLLTEKRTGTDGL